MFLSIFFHTVIYGTLTEEISKSGCSTNNADWDEDLLIVLTTSSQGKENDLAPIGVWHMIFAKVSVFTQRTSTEKCVC